MNFFFAGLTLGFFSSGHCLGMCGPIAFFLGSHQLDADSPWHKRLSLFLQLGAGKALTYGWIGLVFGWAGHLLTRWSRWMGFSEALPWISGILFIFSGLVIAGWLPRFHLAVLGLERQLPRLLQSLRKKQDAGALFSMGMAWGLLPCPMVLAPALGAAIAGSYGGAEGALHGFFMMFGFGLGTIPALYSSAAAARWFVLLRRFSPVGVGVCFILLGAANIFFSHRMMSSGLSCPMHARIF